MSKRTLVALLALVVLAVLVVGCDGSPTPARPTRTTTIVRTPTPVPATDEEAVRQIINAECEAVVQQDIDRLQGIWAADGVVIDANHTPDNTADDVTWKNWDSIRDRYVNVVFPSSPTFCEHPGTTVTVAADKTTATAITGVSIGQTKCDNCNNWVFKKTGNSWKITTLTYNLNPQK
ncbi:MAG: hypothetical protein WCF84_24100 [Anaerolineae bacterium]